MHSSPSSETMTIESERLILRRWKNEDFEPFATYYADEEQSRFIGGPCDRDLAWRKFASIVGHWELRGFGFWALEEKSTGNFVGCCGPWFPEGWPELEIGYWLLPGAHGRGYATEAAGRSKKYAFEELDARSLVSYIDPDNLASIRVAERLGAEYEKTIELSVHGPHSVYRHQRD